MRVCVYPGSFDPVTNGHMDIIARAAKLFDHVVVAALPNSEKSPLFTLEERVALLRRVTKGLPNIEISSFEGLLVDFAKARGACAVIRGVRALSDFDKEFQMALINRQLGPDIDTIFLSANLESLFLSSSIVKEVARLGGDVSAFLPAEICDTVIEKVRKLSKE